MTKKEKNKLYRQNSRLKNGEKYLFNRKRLKLKILLRFEDYKSLIEVQNNKCAICNNPEKVLSQSKKVRALAIDHDHETGKVRGLLCQKCNRALGGFSDSVELLKKATVYLVK